MEPEHIPEERRKEPQTLPVRDKAAELGINLNTIATGLTLAVLVGIWGDINDIKKDVQESKTKNALQTEKYETMSREFLMLRERMNRHENDPYPHARLRFGETLKKNGTGDK